MFGNGPVRSKGSQDGGGQRSVEFVVELEEHQADLIAVGEESVAAGMRDLLHQSLGAQLPEVITKGSEFVLFGGHVQGLQGLWV